MVVVSMLENENKNTFEFRVSLSLEDQVESRFYIVRLDSLAVPR